MSAITAKASRKMKKYAVLTREPRCFLGSFDFSWEQRKLGEIGSVSMCRRIFKEQTSETGDIPFYKIGTFGADPDAFISRELFEEYKSKYPYPQKGDILISASGSIGRTVEFAGNNEYFQDSNIVWLNHDERLSNPFLKCFYSVVKWAGIEGSTIKRLYNDNILNTVICMPSVPEQKRIGLFFENLDNLITLHQRKCALLFSPFQALISMMFTTSTFSWEQRKLSELTSMHARIGWQNLRTSEFLDSGNYMLITGTDFNDGAINFSTCHYVERERYEQDRNIQIHNGSILITKDGTLGKVAYVQGLSMPATLNAGVFNVQIKDANNVDEKYLFQYLKAPFLMDYVDKKATGGTIKHLNQSILVDFPVILPQRSEQTLIGAFFQQLDNLITLHQRKCISFTGRAGRLISTVNKKRITSSWEQRKLGELGTITTGNTPSTSIPDYYSDDGIVWVTPTDICENITFESARKLSDLGQRVGRVVPKNTILVTCIASIGKNTMLGNTGSFNQQINGLTPNENKYDPYFLLTESALWSAKMKGSAAAGTMQIVNRTEFSELKTWLPSLIEQQAIGAFFKQLDHLITLHQRKPFLMKWRNSDANRNQTNRLVL